MNCKNCGGPMRIVEGRDYYVCDYCTAFHFPKAAPDGVRLIGEESELDCPVCGLVLVVGEVAGTDLLKCQRCEGVLVYQEDFPAILRHRMSEADRPLAAREPITAEALGRALCCPMCDEPFDVHPYYGPGHVVIDTCAGCRVLWLDRGEMDTIARASAFELKGSR